MKHNEQYTTYESIFSDNILYIKSNDIVIDPYLLNPDEDNRSGLSIIMKPGDILRKFYEPLIEGFRKMEPDQYYYPFMDLHITVFDFITANANFHLQNPLLEKYIAITGKVFENKLPVDVVFKGIVFSKAAGLIKGYEIDDHLSGIRHRIRTCLQEAGIKSEERYESATAHMTFCRFLRNINNCRDFLMHIKMTKEIPLGEQTFESADLVVHDWYNKAEKCKIIKTFLLKTG